jgi:rod shape-determining protein MreB
MRIPSLHVRGLPADDLAVDLGTTHVFIFSRNRGLLINEPSLVAVDVLDSDVVATGNEAFEMLGRASSHVEIRYPVREGAIADSELVQKMLAKFLRKARGGRPRFSRRIIFAVPTAATSVECRAIRTAVERVGGGKVHLVDALVAAALDTGASIDSARAMMIVDLGGGSTNAGIVADFEVITSGSERVGGITLDRAIAEMVRRRHELLIGEKTAERLKMELGTAVEPKVERSSEVRGQSLLLDRPAAAVVTNLEIYNAMRPIIKQMVDSAKEVLSDLPPEVAADVGEGGVTLTGGGSLLAGAVEHFRSELGLPVTPADSPRQSVARGAARLFDAPLLLRRVDRRVKEKG